VVGRCQSFQGIVVTVVEFDDQRLYHHRKEHRLALLFVPHFLSIACVFGDTATVLRISLVYGRRVKLFTIKIVSFGPFVF